MIFSLEKSDLDLSFNELRDELPKFKNKNILISGASGFFGKNLLEILLYLNEVNSLSLNIYAISRNKNNFEKKFPLIKNRKNFTVIESDIRNLGKIDAKIDFIIHGACDTNPKRIIDDSLNFLQENYLGTINMLEIAKNNPNSHFLYLSSGAVYGSQNSEEFRSENDNSAPDLQNINSVYGEIKRMGEALCTIYHNSFQVKTKIARCFSFVGPHMNFDSHYAIGNFIRDAACGNDIILRSKNKVKRSYLYSVDLIIWLIKILVENNSNVVYNVGSSKAILILELAQKIANIVGKNSRVIINGESESFNTSLSSCYVPSNDKVLKDMNVTEYNSLESSIIKTYNWYKNNIL